MGPAVTMRPPLDERANAELARSISPGSRKLMGVSSTPNVGATDWIAPNCLISKHRYSRHVGRDLFEKFEPFHAYAVLVQNETGGIAARPRQTIHESSADWIDGMCEHDRHGSSYRLQRRNSRAGRGQDDIRGECSQFGCKFTLKGGIACGPANVNPYVLTFGPAQFLKAWPDRCNAGLPSRVIAHTHEHTDPRNLLALRPRRNRPYNRCAAEKCDEVPPSHYRSEPQERRS